MSGERGDDRTCRCQKHTVYRRLGKAEVPSYNAHGAAAPPGADALLWEHEALCV